MAISNIAATERASIPPDACVPIPCGHSRRRAVSVGGTLRHAGRAFRFDRASGPTLTLDGMADRGDPILLFPMALQVLKHPARLSSDRREHRVSLHRSHDGAQRCNQTGRDCRAFFGRKQPASFSRISAGARR